MSRKIKILFRWTPYNHYSLAALMGLLDDRLDPSVFEIGTIEGAEDLASLAKLPSGPLTIIAYSFATPQFSEVKKEIALFKKALGEKVIIIAGGPHATALPESVIEAGADTCFKGEGEESLPVFLKELASGGTPPRGRVIDPLPLGDFETYPPFAPKRTFFSPIEIRRGCPVGCAFCQTPRIFGKIRERGPGYVLRYAEEIKKSGRDLVYFTIPDALSYGATDGGVNIPFLTGFFKGLKGMGMKIHFGMFPSEVSPRRLAKSPEAAKLLKEYITNTKVVIGGQSGSQRVLDSMKRDHTVDEIKRSARILSESGITPFVDMLLGTPGETRSDRLESLKLMKELSIKFGARFNVHYFLPLPGTPFSGKRPEPVENEIKNVVSKFLESGVAIGDFFEQLEFSKG